MKIVHFCAGLEQSNGMSNTARQFVVEELARGDESEVTNDLGKIVPGVDEVMIHGAWLPVLWRAAKAAERIGAKLVIRPAGSYDPVRLAFHGWKKRLVSVWEHRMLRRADTLLATCEAERKWILGYEPTATVEITDLKRFFRFAESRRPQASVRKVLYLGRSHPLKGVEFLQRAVEESGLQLRVVSDHFGEELDRDWEWCDVLCLPTLSENFGRVVAEALERGKRVITTDGAPAWEDYFTAHPDCGVYIKGFCDGDDEFRVASLVKALKDV